MSARGEKRYEQEVDGKTRGPSEGILAAEKEKGQAGSVPNDHVRGKKPEDKMSKMRGNGAVAVPAISYLYETISYG